MIIYAYIIYVHACASVIVFSYFVYFIRYVMSELICICIAICTCVFVSLESYLSMFVKVSLCFCIFVYLSI